MKKLCFFMAIIMVLISFAGCSSEGNINADNKPTDQIDYENSEDKLSGKESASSKKITYYFGFSEGRSFVKFEDEPDSLYCINKNGEIIFSLSDEFLNHNNYPFKNGLLYLEDTAYNSYAFCDMQGNIIRPSDVGVNQFYDDALSEGYIFAEVVTADYNYTKKELGIMNTDFEWVVEPSEQLHNNCSHNNELIFEEYDREATYNYAANEYYYFNHEPFFETVIDLKTGKTYSYSDMPFEPSSKGYKENLQTDNIEDPEGNVIVDVSKLAGSSRCYVDSFIGDYAIIHFTNSNDVDYTSLVNTNGNLAFQPVEGYGTSFDGEYLCIKATSGTTLTYKILDTNGNILGTHTIDGSSPDFVTPFVNVFDGVVSIESRSPITNAEENISLYNPDMTPLF